MHAGHIALIRSAPRLSRTSRSLARSLSHIDMLRLICAVAVPRAALQRSSVVGSRRWFSAPASDEGEVGFDMAVFERTCSAPVATSLEGTRRGLGWPSSWRRNECTT